MPKILVYAISFAFVLLSLSNTAHAIRAIDDENDPGRLFGDQYENRLSQLPLKGAVRQPLWSDTYWSSRDGGAAVRWQFAGTSYPISPRDYGFLQVWQLSQLSDDQLNSLSPAEKYDLAIGRYDFPTVQHELARTHANDPKWYGLCHAVASVTTRYFEPQNTVVRTTFPDGSQRQILFYSSDLKALLALAADRAVQTSPGVGQRCNSGVASADGACWDTNPASFFMAVANQVGLSGESIIIDVDPLQEVWNAAVKSYSAKVSATPSISARAARGTVRQVRVDLNLQHTIGAKPSRAPTGGQFKTEIYAFTLELGAAGEILGGEWLTANRPDSVWATGQNFALDPHFDFLTRLVQAKPGY